MNIKFTDIIRESKQLNLSVGTYPCSASIYHITQDLSCSLVVLDLTLSIVKLATKYPDLLLLLTL